MHEAGVSFVPADRQRFGLVLSFPLTDNLILTDYYAEPYSTGHRARRGRHRCSAPTRPSSSSTSGRRAPGRHGRHALRRQPAEAHRGPRVRPRAVSCSCSTSRRAASMSGSIEFIHRQIIAKRDAGTAVAARLGGARRDPGAVRPHRRDVSRPHRRRSWTAAPRTRRTSGCSWRPVAGAKPWQRHAGHGQHGGPPRDRPAHEPLASACQLARHRAEPIDSWRSSSARSSWSSTSPIITGGLDLSARRAEAYLSLLVEGCPP